MHQHAIDIKEFYATATGRVLQRILRQKLRGFWSDLSGKNVLGLGYATPYLSYYLKETQRVIAVMPPSIGAIKWPESKPNLVTLSNMNALPFENNMFDNAFIVHGLEMTDDVYAMLNEIWRVLDAQGRLIIIVPNRTGVWSRRDNTPLGHGTPFSTGQLRKILRETMFTVERTDHAVYIPPVSSRLLLSMAPAWERIGHKVFPALGGVTIIEASKQLFAGIAVRNENRLWQGKKILVPDMSFKVKSKIKD